jgi:hypothetical protein
MGDTPDQEPSDFYGTSGPATPPGGAWPPPPLWRPVVQPLQSMQGRPGRDADPFPVPHGNATAPPLERSTHRSRRSRKHLVGYPLTALTALAVGVAVMSPGGSGAASSEVAAPVSQPGRTVTVTATPPPGTGTVRAAAPAPAQTTTKRKLTADPTTAPAEGRSSVLKAAGGPFRDCEAAEAAGATPLEAGDPGYSATLDEDGNGVACD